MMFGVAAPAEPARTSLDTALDRVGDRWSLRVIDSLLARPLRFNELQEAIVGISTNILANRLKHLEAQRVVLAAPYQERPVRHTYELTQAGRDLAGALRLLEQWGGERDGDKSTAHEHAPCGTPLEVRWYCPSCDEVVDTEHLDDPPYL